MTKTDRKASDGRLARWMCETSTLKSQPSIRFSTSRFQTSLSLNRRKRPFGPRGSRPTTLPTAPRLMTQRKASIRPSGRSDITGCVAKAEVAASPRDRSGHIKTSPTGQMSGDGGGPSGPITVTAGWPCVQLCRSLEGEVSSFWPPLPFISDCQSRCHVGLRCWHAVG